MGCWRRYRNCKEEEERERGAKKIGFVRDCISAVIRFLEGALSLFGKYGSDVEKRAQEIPAKSSGHWANIELR
jgi:hypothetical protein